jgi:hypothetical protein
MHIINWRHTVNNKWVRIPKHWHKVLDLGSSLVINIYMLNGRPFGISTMIGPNPDASLSWVTTITGYMGFTNSCINSVLYGLMNGNIRKAYFEVLPCLRKNSKWHI